MEFTWRMVGALAWPAVVIVAVLVFRKWITERLESLGVSLGQVSVQLKSLNSKVDTVGNDISTTLSDNVPRPVISGIPESLVDLIAAVSQNRMEGIRAAFDLVYRALKENYPQLRRVLPAQLPEAMDRLVDKGEMEPDVALSVKQLYELLVMPEWQKDEVGDTRGYAFLMLAEGAIHGILRSAQARGSEPSEDSPSSGAPGLTSLWHGTYDSRFPIELAIGTWSGRSFDGTMTYPDGDTVTTVSGTAEAVDGSVRLTWKELAYVRKGSRPIDFNGSYAATIAGDSMDGAWYQADRLVARFTMTAYERSATPTSPAKPNRTEVRK
jgi:hypothetical protein